MLTTDMSGGQCSFSAFRTYWKRFTVAEHGTSIEIFRRAAHHYCWIHARRDTSGRRHGGSNIFSGVFLDHTKRRGSLFTCFELCILLCYFCICDIPNHCHALVCNGLGSEQRWVYLI